MSDNTNSANTRVIQDIYVQEYSERALVVRGNTKAYKDQLKQLGCKYNSKLRDSESSTGTSAGWILSKAKSGAAVNAFLETGEIPEEGEGAQGVAPASVITPKKQQPLEDRKAPAGRDAPAGCPRCADLKKELAELNQKMDRILTFFEKSERIRKNVVAGAGNMMKNIFGTTAEMMRECAPNEERAEDFASSHPPLQHRFGPVRITTTRSMRPPPCVTVLDEDDCALAPVLLED